MNDIDLQLHTKGLEVAQEPFMTGWDAPRTGIEVGGLVSLWVLKLDRLRRAWLGLKQIPVLVLREGVSRS